MGITGNKNGFVIMESLVAVGLAAMIFSALIGMMLIANQTSAKAVDRQTAIWRAQEGMEALRTVSFDALTLTETGVVSFAGNQWSLSDAGPQDLGNGLERTVRVQEVRRDADCDVVTSGGDPDEDSRILESAVSWTDGAGREQTVVYKTLRTRWDDPQGTCFASIAGQITFDTSLATWGGAKQLRDTFLTNTSKVPAVIDKVRLTWDNDRLIEQMFMDNSKVWSDTGPGTPLGDQPSGTLLDASDFTIEPGETVEMHKVQFTDTMQDVTMTLEIHFDDGSVFTSEPFVPSN